MLLTQLLVRLLPSIVDEFDGDADDDSDANVSTGVDAVGNADNGGNDDKDVDGCSAREVDNDCDVKNWTNLQIRLSISIFQPVSNT